MNLIPRVKRTLPFILLVLAVLAIPATSFGHQPDFTDSFMIERCQFSSSGSNPFFILEPGYQLMLEGEGPEGHVQLTVTVLGETRRLDGVKTRVVEERETHDGELVEVSRNYFAICAPTNSVFYFGEEVDIYEGGVIVSHAGAWRAGENGARPGVIMPGLNLLGGRYFQEVAPGVAMDRAETISLTERVSTPAGDFENSLRVEETTPLEPGVREYKLYAPGIGLVQDGSLQLVTATAP